MTKYRLQISDCRILIEYNMHDLGAVFREETFGPLKKRWKAIKLEKLTSYVKMRNKEHFLNFSIPNIIKQSNHFPCFLSSQEDVLVHVALGARTRVSKLWPGGHIWPSTRFYPAISNWWHSNPIPTILSLTWPFKDLCLQKGWATRQWPEK